MKEPDLQPFQLSDSLLKKLENAQRKKGYCDEITQSYGAFLLFGGFGDPAYLTRDGWVILEDWSWFEKGPIRKATSGEAIANLVIGISNTGVEELRSLLPQRDAKSEDCPLCVSSGWFQIVPRTSTNEPGKIICPSCSGLGWKSQFWIHLPQYIPPSPPS